MEDEAIQSYLESGADLIEEAVATIERFCQGQLVQVALAPHEMFEIRTRQVVVHVRHNLDLAHGLAPDVFSFSRAKQIQLGVNPEPLTVCWFDDPQGRPCMRIYPDRTFPAGKTPSGGEFVFKHYCGQHSNGGSRDHTRRKEVRARRARGELIRSFEAGAALRDPDTGRWVYSRRVRKLLEQNAEDLRLKSSGVTKT